jgi:hypothetical protein
MQRMWKGYGLMTSTGFLMLDFIGSTRRQVREKAEGAHGQEWKILKKNAGWKIVPLSIVTTLPELRVR